MTEHPILFSGPLVRAILDGSKTVTRRPVRRPSKASPESFQEAMSWAQRNGKPGVAKIGPCDGIEWRTKPPCLAGDRLWVRETWACWYGAPDDYGRVRYQATGDIYETDGRSVCSIPSSEVPPESHKWKPSIHMPRWACRLLLDVVDVRVERLQDITEAEARAEGMDPRPGPSDEVDCGSGHGYFEPAPSAVGMFEEAWDAIYGKGPYAWRENPWVWRIEFRKVTP